MLQITQLGRVPSMSALLGAQGSQKLLEHINPQMGNSYFGSTVDKYQSQYNNFLTTYIEPIREANAFIKIAVDKLYDVDTIRPIETYDDLRNIPSSMVLPLLTYNPLYKLLKQGRIDGWGFIADNLEDTKESMDRLIDKNGTVELMFDEPIRSENGVDTYVASSEVWSYETPYSLEEREYIWNARTFIQKVLDETDLDPTNIDQMRG